MYTFDKANCTEPFVAMIHQLAFCAALTNLWPVSVVRTVDGANILPAKTL